MCFTISIREIEPNRLYWHLPRRVKSAFCGEKWDIWIEKTFIFTNSKAAFAQHQISLGVYQIETSIAYKFENKIYDCMYVKCILYVFIGVIEWLHEVVSTVHVWNILLFYEPISCDPFWFDTSAHYLFVVQFLIFFKDVNNVLKVRFTFHFFSEFCLRVSFASFHELYGGVF